jgi:hypothetical protein
MGSKPTRAARDRTIAQIATLRVQAKVLRRSAGRSGKRAIQGARAGLRALDEGDHGGADRCAESAQRLGNQATRQKRLATRIDAVAMELETQLGSDDLGGAMARAGVVSIDPEHVEAAVEAFERAATDDRRAVAVSPDEPVDVVDDLADHVAAEHNC